MVSVMVAISCVFFSSISAAATCNVRGDGKLRIYSYHLDDYLDVTYRQGEKYNQEALSRLNIALRSPDSETTKLNVQLVDIIDNIQDHFSARTIEIISAFRSPKYNKGLKEEGRGVASRSLHTEGRAIDIHIDEATEKAVKEYALSLNCGGVGFYPGLDFVHVDVGPNRTWGEVEKTRKLVGLDNNPSKNTLTSDKNDYFLKDKILLNFTNKMRQSLEINSCATIETFRNGKWIKVGDVDLLFSKSTVESQENILTKIKTSPRACKSKEKIDLPFGRFRIVLESKKHKGDKPVITFSNEFYIKKI